MPPAYSSAPPGKQEFGAGVGVVGVGVLVVVVVGGALSEVLALVV